MTGHVHLAATIAGGVLGWVGCVYVTAWVATLTSPTHRARRTIEQAAVWAGIGTGTALVAAAVLILDRAATHADPTLHGPVWGATRTVLIVYLLAAVVGHRWPRGPQDRHP